MDDGVKFIFRTLLKVPFIIAICYFILNVFTFGVSYFQLLGLSNTIQQIAMDNNFIPGTDLESLIGDGSLSVIDPRNTNNLDDQLQGYIGDIAKSSGCLENIQVVINTKGTFNIDDPNTWVVNDRVQYGTEITCGVVAKYRPILPLLYHDTLEDGKVAGFKADSSSETAGGGFKDPAAIEAAREDINNAAITENNMKFLNTVVGLQYYSDDNFDN